jgi:hypothetical protein
MRLSTRPWATAGVALAGASLIAATPVARAVPDIQTETAAVQLTAGRGCSAQPARSSTPSAST